MNCEMAPSRKAIRCGPAILMAAMMFVGCAAQHQATSNRTETQPPQAQEELRDRQDAGKSAEARPQRAQEKPQAGQKSQKSAEEALQAAREKLQISQNTEKQVQAEFEKLQQSAQATAEIKKDYETYLDRIRSLVAENRELVAKLEAAMASPAGAPNKSGQTFETTAETAQLDRQLNEALSEFDEMLLKEMELIRTQSAPRMTSLAEEAAAAADRLRKKGIDLDTSEEEAPESPREVGNEENDSEKSPDSGKAQAPAQAEAGRAGSETGTGSEAEAGGSGSKQARTETDGQAAGTSSPDRNKGYSTDDDDIVARQLREAAENETDPELKKKLWKEYEDYRRNTAK